MNPFLPALVTGALVLILALAALVDEALRRRRARTDRQLALRRVRFIEQETNRQLVELLWSRSPRR